MFGTYYLLDTREEVDVHKKQPPRYRHKMSAVVKLAHMSSVQCSLYSFPSDVGMLEFLIFYTLWHSNIIQPMWLHSNI